MSCKHINEFGNIGSFDCFIFISPKLVTGNIKHVQNIPPESYALYPNYPNPFNPTTKIKYQIPKLSFIIPVTTLLLFMNINQLPETIMKEIYYGQTHRGGKITKRPIKIILITFIHILTKTSYERHPLLKNN